MNNENVKDAVKQGVDAMFRIKAEKNFIKDLSEKIKINTYRVGKIGARIEFIVDPIVILAGLAIIYFSIEIFHMTMAQTGILTPHQQHQLP